MFNHWHIPLSASIHASSSSQALGAIRDERAVEPLTAALRDPDKDVRATVARALMEFHTPKAWRAVEQWRREQGE